MGLDDARRRLEAAAAAAASVPDRAVLYAATAAEVSPMIGKLALALQRRVPVVQYRRQYETERAAQFAAARGQNRRLKRREFTSRHKVVNDYEADGGVGIQFINDGPGGAVVMAARWVQLPIPAANLRLIMLSVNLDTRNWDVRIQHTRYAHVGPDTQYWARCLVPPGQSPGYDELSQFSGIAVQEPWRVAFVHGVEECVVLLADHYNIPQQEVES